MVCAAPSCVPHQHAVKGRIALGSLNTIEYFYSPLCDDCTMFSATISPLHSPIGLWLGMLRTNAQACGAGYATQQNAKVSKPMTRATMSGIRVCTAAARCSLLLRIMFLMATSTCVRLRARATGLHLYCSWQVICNIFCDTAAYALCMTHTFHVIMQMYL